MSSSPTSLEDLLARIDSAWADLQAGLDGLTEAQFNTPDAGGWSIKDNLAHLSAWEHYLVASHLQGQPPHLAHGLDEATLAAGEDAINAAIQQRSRGRSVADIRAEADRVHTATLQALRSLPFSSLLQPRFADDPEQRPRLDWVVNNTYDHYAEHGAYIQKQLQALSG